MSLCGVWWCSNSAYMASAFLKVKKSSSWKTLCLKREAVYVRVHSHGIALSKWVLRWRTSTAPAIVTSESIEPNNNDELHAVVYPLSKIFQPEICLKVTKQTLTVPSAIMNSFPSSVFPSEANWKTKKKYFLYCARFRSFLVPFTNTKTFIEGKTKYIRSTTK